MSSVTTYFDETWHVFGLPVIRRKTIDQNIGQNGIARTNIGNNRLLLLTNAGQ